MTTNDVGREFVCPGCARALAGHTTEIMTKRYDHSDLEKAIKVAQARNQKYLEQKKQLDTTVGNRKTCQY